MQEVTWDREEEMECDNKKKKMWDVSRWSTESVV